MAEAAGSSEQSTESAHAADNILNLSECLSTLCKQELIILVAGVITWMQEYNSHLAKISTPNYVSAFFQALTAPTQKISNITFYNSWITNLKKISDMSTEDFVVFVDILYQQLNTNSKKTNNEPNRIEIAHKLLDSLKALQEYVTNTLSSTPEKQPNANDQTKLIAEHLIFALAALATDTSNTPLTNLVYDPNIGSKQSELLIPGCPKGSFTKECFEYILSALNFKPAIEKIETIGSRANCVFDAIFNAAANNFAHAAVDNLYTKKLLEALTKTRTYVPPHRRSPPAGLAGVCSTFMRPTPEAHDPTGNHNNKI